MRWDLGLTLIALAALVFLYQRDRLIHRRVRGNFFADCLGIFQAYRVVQDEVYYPVLTGRYRGFDIRLEPIVDHVAWRKIPSLWLKVSVLQQVQRPGVFDLLMRPQGVEFYSPSGSLDYRVPLPPDWPRDAVLYTDDAETPPPLQAISPHIHLFADPRMKELVMTPAGTRLVFQVDQADRSHYTVLRQVKFEITRLAPHLAQSLIDSAIGIHGSVAA